MKGQEFIQCGECLYFRTERPKDQEKPLADQRGTCHLNPPTGKDGFARVDGIDFCGQGVAGKAPFQAKESFVRCFQ